MPQEERVNVPQSKCNIAVHGAFYEHPFDALNTFNNLFHNCVLVSYLIQSRDEHLIETLGWFVCSFRWVSGFGPPGAACT